MNYRTYLPCQELQEFVICYWTLEDDTQQKVMQKQNIVPDGCMEMIFHYGDLYKQYLNDEDVILQPKCFVIGQLTKPLSIEPTGRTGIFAVRFRPGGFLPFSNTGISSMNDTAVSLETLFGINGADMGEKILQASTTMQRIELIELFLKELFLDSKTIDRIVRSTVDIMFRLNGHLHIGNHAQQSLMNRRDLERRFIKNIGLSPKKIARIIRMQSALKMMLSESQADLTRIACDSQYFDQSHFIKDFKEFTGWSPKNFFGDMFQLSTIFYGTE